MSKQSADGADPDTFETDVRQICGQLYGSNGASGPVLIDGRERDGVFDTGSELVIVEATMRIDRSKIEGDYKKTLSALAVLQREKKYYQHNFRILLVTYHEPTAEQRTVIEKHRGCPIDIMSYRTLLSKLMDGRTYLRLRDGMSFGSIQNPTDPSRAVARAEYIPLQISSADTGKEISPTALGSRLVQSQNAMAAARLTADRKFLASLS